VEACMASELTTGRNKFGKLSNPGDIPDWDAHIEAPNLECLVLADNFKTPKKVQVIAAMKKEVDKHFVEVVEIGMVSPLNANLFSTNSFGRPKENSGEHRFAQDPIQMRWLLEKIRWLEGQIFCARTAHWSNQGQHCVAVQRVQSLHD
jgi:hypothetical protein